MSSSSSRSVLTFNIKDKQYSYLSKGSNPLHLEEKTRLGSGAFGTVHLYQAQDGSDIVIKHIPIKMEFAGQLLPKDEIDKQIQATKNEAKFNRRYHGYGEYYYDEELSIVFLLMKKLPPSLHSVLDEIIKDIDYVGLIDLNIKIIRELKNLHAQGIMHRDIRLGNMCISEEKEVIFCDFGNAKNLTQNPKERQKDIELEICNLTAMLGEISEKYQKTQGVDSALLAPLTKIHDQMMARKPILYDEAIALLEKERREFIAKNQELVVSDLKHVTSTVKQEEKTFIVNPKNQQNLNQQLLAAVNQSTISIATIEELLKKGAHPNFSKKSQRSLVKHLIEAKQTGKFTDADVIKIKRAAGFPETHNWYKFDWVSCQLLFASNDHVRTDNALGRNIWRVLAYLQAKKIPYTFYGNEFNGHDGYYLLLSEEAHTQLQKEIERGLQRVQKNGCAENIIKYLVQNKPDPKAKIQESKPSFFGPAISHREPTSDEINNRKKMFKEIMDAVFKSLMSDKTDHTCLLEMMNALTSIKQRDENYKIFVVKLLSEIALAEKAAQKKAADVQEEQDKAYEFRIVP